MRKRVRPGLHDPRHGNPDGHPLTTSVRGLCLSSVTGWASGYSSPPRSGVRMGCGTRALWIGYLSLRIVRGRKR